MSARVAQVGDLLSREGAFAVTERCAYCDFTVRATLEEARARWDEHECDRPPPPPKQKHRRGGV